MLLLNYVLYSLVIISFIAVFISIGRDHVKRMDRADEVVAKSYPVLNFELFLTLLPILLLLTTTGTFLSSFEKTYLLLVPDYHDYWYDLLWLENIEKMRYYFWSQEMVSEALTVSNYYYHLQTFLSFLTAVFGGFPFLYTGLRGAELCESGIYGSKYKIPWDKVKKYEWNEQFKRGKPKYRLTLYSEPLTRFQSYFSSEKITVLLIDTNLKTVVDNLLDRKIGKDRKNNLP